MHVVKIMIIDNLIGQESIKLCALQCIEQGRTEREELAVSLQKRII